MIASGYKVKQGFTNTKKYTQPKRVSVTKILVGVIFIILIGWTIGGLFVSSKISKSISEDLERELEDELVSTSEITVIKFYTSRDCDKDSFLNEFSDENGDDNFISMCDRFSGFPKIGSQVMSAKVVGNGHRAIDVYSSCSSHGPDKYSATIFPLDGCVNVFNFPKLGYISFSDSGSNKVQIPREVRELQYSMQDRIKSGHQKDKIKANIVFSCESSEYFSYQVMTNYYAFLSSGQQQATWTRLLTSRTPDDLSTLYDGLATYQAKRHLYSRRYSPLNKPDVLHKWLLSADRPKEDIIVVIDPDNWLLKDMSEYYSEISEGQAIGEPAYYFGSTTAQKLWKELCEHNCGWEMDLVGVPYIVHRKDLEKIAPLWKHYTLKIKGMLETSNPNHQTFGTKYKRLDVNWATEMFAYNMASAHSGVRHKAVRRIQVRDVDGQRKASALKDVKMLHIGRAWFPKNHPDAKPWIHTEGKSFRGYGDQVWCKCNFTASQVLPWPLPSGLDFQSQHTLELLHHARVRFGPVPANSKFRKGPGKGTYSASVN